MSDFSDLSDFILKSPCGLCYAPKGQRHHEYCPKYRTTIKEWIESHDVVQYGDFTLSSGKKSDFYCDAKKIMLNGVGMRLVAEEMSAALYNYDINAIGGMELGAVPIIGVLMPTCPRLRGFIVRKKPKEHGLQKLIEGPVLAGMRVAIVEDVTTTGESAMKAVRAANAFGLSVVVIGTIIDRNEGATKLFKAEGFPFFSLWQR